MSELAFAEAEFRRRLTAVLGELDRHDPHDLAGLRVPGRAGYPVGINFPPRRIEWEQLSFLPDDNRELRAGMVFHVPRYSRQPDDRAAGRQQAPLSETVLVTDTGHRVLTDLPREFVVCG